jgi:CRISPR-associated protein Cas1
MKETLYIFTSGKLNRKDNTLLLTPSKEDDENSKTNGNNNNKIFLPIERIKDIFIFSEVTINTKLINFLASNEVIVHFFNYYGYYIQVHCILEKNI